MFPLSNSSHGPLLCYVTDRRSLPKFERRKAQETLLSKIAAAAASGVDWIQIREKDLSGRDCALLTREALQRAVKSPACNGASARVLVNDRLDIALSERAGGLHLGETRLPLPETKRFIDNRGEREDFVIGVSCHSLEAAKLERLAEVCHAVSIPVLAIGGITLAKASDCLAAGASGIAAIRLFQDARDLPSLVQSLRKQAR